MRPPAKIDRHRSSSRQSLCVLLGLYIGLYLTNVPGLGHRGHDSGRRAGCSSRPSRRPSSSDPHPTWVSYYAVSPTSTRLASRHHLSTCRRTRWCRSRSTSTTAHSGLRNPFISQATGTVGGTFTAQRQADQGDRPRHAPRTCSRSRRWASRSRCRGRRQRQEPMRQRAVHAEHGPRDDHLHVPHARPGPVPLAVLRALRGRIHRGLRRADADSRLHGRLHQGRHEARCGERGQPLAPRRAAGGWSPP